LFLRIKLGAQDIYPVINPNIPYPKANFYQGIKVPNMEDCPEEGLPCQKFRRISFPKEFEKLPS